MMRHKNIKMQAEIIIKKTSLISVIDFIKILMTKTVIQIETTIVTVPNKVVFFANFIIR
jgi:hypothetical protein